MAWHVEHESTNSCQSVLYMTVRGVRADYLLTAENGLNELCILSFLCLNTVNAKQKECT